MLFSYIVTIFVFLAANAAAKLGFSRLSDPTCSNGFMCNDGTCIPSQWECDFYGDCAEGEDEVGGEAGCVPCYGESFQCPAGPGKICLPAAWECDGTPQCANGADELACGVTTVAPDDGCDGFACEINDYCVPDSWYCDGESDCVDGSDESGCPTTPDPVTSCFESHFDMALYGYNDEVVRDLTVRECMEQALAGGYASFDYVSRSSRCYLSSETHLTQPEDFGPHDGSDYYLNLC